MRTYQKFMCIGRMGKDPEAFQAGTSVKANLSVATSKSYKDSAGNWQEETDWHSVELWNDQASRVLDETGPRKGDLVLIEGEVRYRQYQAQDGTNRYATSIRAFVCNIMERHQAAPQQQGQAAPQYNPNPNPQQQYNNQPQYQPQYQPQQQQQYNTPAPNFNNTPAQPARQRNQPPPAQAQQPQQQIDYSQDLPF